MLCKYAESLGTPGQGFHSHFMGIAYMDIIATIIGSEIIAYLFDWNIYLVLLAVVLTGIFLHRLFCVRTTVDKWLFP
jgi:hypothetical protein